MKNFGFELKEKDKIYLQYKNNKTFYVEIKYFEEKSKIEIEKLKNIEKYILEKKEKITLKKEENIKLRDKLNNEIQINNLNNNSIINENTNINKNDLKTSFSLGKIREEKKLIIPEEALKIKITKDKNGFFQDKNESGKYLNLKKYIKNNNILRNVYLIIIISLLQLTNNKIKFIENKFSNITLKINGTGTQYKNILSNYFNNSYYPNIIYINGIKQPTITYRFKLNETDNFVKLIWNNTINNCYEMFCKCKDITEIDLSNFDTSKVTDMGSMFYDCSSLSSIDLSNFNTSKVTDMGGMFSGCSSLSSIDLSNFNTSKVTDMGLMFSGCSSLFSLNFFNFNTSNVTDMEHMFKGCSSLSS